MMQSGAIYLASRSSRRRELLRQIGVGFEVVLLRATKQRGVDVDETPLAGEASDEYVLRICREKARSATAVVRARRLAEHAVLAADTTVVCEDAILGKPSDIPDAERMLTLLSGRSHRVLTAVAVAREDSVEMRLSVSTVWFRALSKGEICRYVAAGESADKAGAYAVQGRAASFITRIDGSYSGIMGLPLAETAELLRNHGIIVP